MRDRRRSLTFPAPSTKVAAVIEFFNPPDAPAPGAFSRATRAGGLIFVSGTGASNDTGGRPPDTSAAEQTRQALKNVETILKATGSSLDRVVQMTLLITDPTDYREINAKVAFACIALAGDRAR